MTEITWLHLSDWHQGGKEFDRKVVGDALLKDLLDRANINPDLAKIDFLVFSGDIAFSGQAEEYTDAIVQLFTPVLEATGLSPDRLFIVPGNHDLDRKKFRYLPVELKQPFESEMQVQDWLVDDENREYVLSPFAAYHQFVSTFAGQNQPLYSTTRKFKIDNKQVALLGLNSALMCGRNTDAKGIVNDYGFLVVGEPQIHDALKQIADADVRISVLHHPFGWLAEFDRIRIEEQLEKNCHFILYGHQHLPKVIVGKGTTGDCVTIPAGASYDRRLAHDPRYTNAYNLVHLDFETAEGIVYLRRWSDRQNTWLADTDSYTNGIFQIQLPKLLSRSSALITPPKLTFPSQADHSESRKITTWGSFVPDPTVPINGSNLPQRFAQIVGRDDDIKEVLEALASRDWIVNIDGMGGIGKTTLALEVAHRCRKREVGEIVIPNFTGYIWTSARDKSNFGLADVVQAINQTIAPHEANSLTADKAIWLAKRVLSVEPRLLIIDNFETVKDEELYRFLRDELSDPSKVLITSRHNNKALGKVIQLDGLSINEAINLLKMEAQRWNMQIRRADEPKLELVAEKSLGIPFVLKWALENIYNGKSLEWVLEALENATADDVFDYIFSRSLSALDKQTRELFRAMAVFKAPVSVQDVRALFPGMPALQERIGTLVRLSLLEDNRRFVEEDKRYWLDPFTRYLTERELGQEPEVQASLRDLLAKHLILNVPTKRHALVKNCEQLGIEADNYFEAIAWICQRNRLSDTTVWYRVAEALEALRKCHLITTANRSEIAAQAQVSIKYSYYRQRLLATTTHEFTERSLFLTRADRVTTLAPLESQKILPVGLALQDTMPCRIVCKEVEKVSRW